MNSNRTIPAMGALLLSAAVIVSSCAGGPLTTREEGAGLGTLGGAAAGAAIGAALHHPAAGALIGGALGLGAGALVGDQLQKGQMDQAEQQRTITRQKAELSKNQAMIDQLKKSNIEAKETERGVVVNLPAVQFAFDSYNLTGAGISRVDQIAATIKKQAPARKISVEGYASRESASQEEYNLELSEKRASAVASELENAGVDKDNVNVRGFGTRLPIASNDTESGRQQNRRVEVIIEDGNQISAR